jgi:hypothetical protein
MSVLVDTILTGYQELFTVRLNHPRYELSLSTPSGPIVNSTILRDLEPVPDTATRQFFRNNTIGFTTGNNMIICFVRNELTEPFIPLPSARRIRFLLKNRNDFLKNTKTETDWGKKVYQFTNKDGVGNASNRFITRQASGVSADDLEDAAVVNAEESCFGVIDIHTDVTDNFYRLTNGGQLESPPFNILFKRP